MGGGGILLKTSVPLSLMTTYRKSLISAGSIARRIIFLEMCLLAQGAGSCGEFSWLCRRLQLSSGRPPQPAAPLLHMVTSSCCCVDVIMASVLTSFCCHYEDIFCCCDFIISPLPYTLRLMTQYRCYSHFLNDLIMSVLVLAQRYLSYIIHMFSRRCLCPLPYTLRLVTPWSLLFALCLMT
jgi:hypothetical protein